MRVAKQQPPRVLPWPKFATSQWLFPIIVEACNCLNTYAKLNGLNEKQACAQARIDYNKWNAAKRNVGPWHLELIIGALQLMGQELHIRPIPGEWADPTAHPNPTDPTEPVAPSTPSEEPFVPNPNWREPTEL